MGLYKDPRTGQTKEFDTASEAAGEGYFEEVKLGDLQVIAGQEDQIIEAALEMKDNKKCLKNRKY